MLVSVLRDNCLTTCRHPDNVDDKCNNYAHCQKFQIIKICVIAINACTHAHVFVCSTYKWLHLKLLTKLMVLSISAKWIVLINWVISEACVCAPLKCAATKRSYKHAHSHISMFFALCQIISSLWFMLHVSAFQIVIPWCCCCCCFRWTNNNDKKWTNFDKI